VRLPALGRAAAGELPVDEGDGSQAVDGERWILGVADASSGEVVAVQVAPRSAEETTLSV
jgi:hypothetical protein